MTPLEITLLVICIILVLAIISLVLAIFFLPVLKKNKATKQANKIIKDAEVKADHIVKNAQIDGKQTIYEQIRFQFLLPRYAPLIFHAGFRHQR